MIQTDQSSTNNDNPPVSANPPVSTNLPVSTNPPVTKSTSNKIYQLQNSPVTKSTGYKIHQLQNLSVTKSTGYKIDQLQNLSVTKSTSYQSHTLSAIVYFIFRCCKRSNQTRNLSFRHMYRVNVFKLDLPLTLTQMNLLNDIYQIKE